MPLLQQHLKHIILFNFPSELKSDLTDVLCVSGLMDDGLQVKMHSVLQMTNSQLKGGGGGVTLSDVGQLQ